MRRLTYAGLVLFALGAACWLLAGFVDLVVVFEALGRGAVGAAGVVSGIILLPFTYSIAPLYSALTWGDWMPFLLSAAGCWVLAPMSRHMSGNRHPEAR